MRLYIMTEPNFKETTRCDLILKGLKENLRKKRIQYIVIDTLSTIDVNNEKTFLFLIATNRTFITKAIAECEVKKIHPIVISLQLFDSIPGFYSSVAPNMEHSMRHIMNYLKNNEKKSPALYGISVNSAPDVARKNFFLQRQILPTGENDIYYNLVGLDDCFDKFLKNINNYDCVICTNNYVAIHLINNLKKHGFSVDNFTILSYGITHIAKKFYPEILYLDIPNESLGKTAITVFEQLQNNDEILFINASVKCDISDGFNFISEYNAENNNIFEENISDVFYEDPYVQNMLLVEKLLSFCDATDIVILDSVLNGDSYDEISNKSFLSYSAVKYRVRNMMQSCNCTTKSQFVSFVKTYMQK